MKNENINACRRSSCAISMALDAIGDKWSLLILRDLMFTGKRSYGEFQASAEGIATNILATRLQTMEAEGIITKETDPDNKRKVLYHLTEKGIALLPVVMELMHWSSQYLPAAESCNKKLRPYVRNRNTVIEELTARLREEHLD